MSMDLEAVRAFVEVAAVASFTRAADNLGLSKARISTRVQGLEEELGSRLLQRTTRAVKLTPDGEQFLPRARRLLQDADDVSAMFRAPSALRGQVRLDLPINIARELVIPRLPEFLATHPQLELLLSSTDRRVDVVREGFDCVLRIGALADSGLVARKLGVLPMVNGASPAYLARYGIPHSVEELDHHLVVHYSLSFGADAPCFEHRAGAGWTERPMRSVITVNNADAYLAACVAGLGIIQAPRMGMRAGLAAGTILEVLPDATAAPMPVSLVHAHARNAPRRVRVVMAWLAGLLELVERTDPSSFDGGGR